MVGQNGRTYETTVEVTSPFDAADRAIQQWARLWWYRPGAVVEVRMGRSMLEGQRGAGQRVAAAIEGRVAGY